MCVKARGLDHVSSLMSLLSNFLRQGLSLNLSFTDSGDQLGVLAQEHICSDRHIMTSFLWGVHENPNLGPYAYSAST